VVELALVLDVGQNPVHELVASAGLRRERLEDVVVLVPRIEDHEDRAGRIPEDVRAAVAVEVPIEEHGGRRLGQGCAAGGHVARRPCKNGGRGQCDGDQGG
jgi:hypothetical protein